MGKEMNYSPSRGDVVVFLLSGTAGLYFFAASLLFGDVHNREVVNILRAVVMSYTGILMITGPIMYGVYGVIAYRKRRVLGLSLFVAHYLFAILGLLVTYALGSDPHATKMQFQDGLSLFQRYETLKFVLAPFLFLNLWYLWRILTPVTNINNGKLK